MRAYQLEHATLCQLEFQVWMHEPLHGSMIVLRTPCDIGPRIEIDLGLTTD